MEFRPARLRRGAGSGDPADGLCLMQMVDWFSGSSWVCDHPVCASPVLCCVGIELNDRTTSRRRDMLWPLVWKLLDSYDPKAEQRRSEHLLREVTHRLVVPAFNGIAKGAFEEEDMKPCLCAASLMRAAGSMQEIEVAARIASQDTRNCLEAMFLADTTAVMARMCVAGACFASDFERYMTEFVSRALELSKYHGMKRKSWSIMRDIFEETIMLGKHGEQDPVACEPRANQLRALLGPKYKDEPANFLV